MNLSEIHVSECNRVGTRLYTDLGIRWLATKFEKGHILATTRTIKARRHLPEPDQLDRNSDWTLIESVAIFHIINDSDIRRNRVEMIQQVAVFAGSDLSR